jgi:hypothetical protein
VGRKLSILTFTLSFAGAALFTLPAMTAPIGVSKGVTAILPDDGGEITQIRAARGGYRGGQFIGAPPFGGEALLIEGER